MKAHRVLALALLLVGSATAVHVAQAQAPGIKRTDLMRHGLSAPGREVVQTRVELGPGVVFGRHWHPGEELVYVLEGSLEYQLAGKPAVVLQAGDVLFIPARTVHAVRNVGGETGSELATYIVEKGKPLLVKVE